MTDSAISTTSEEEDEELGEDLGDLDDLLASLKKEDEPAPKRGRKSKGSGNKVTPEPTFQNTASSRELVDENGSITISRQRLSGGKYMRWAANPSDDQMYGLLWLIGEFGIRSSEHSFQEIVGVPGRARTGLLGILEFVHGKPLTQEEATKAIRNAYKVSSSNQVQN